MKLSGFVFGGLIGAAAALYVSRKRPGAAAWAASAVSDVCSNVARKSMSRWLNADWKKEAAELAPKPIDDTAEKSAAAWNQIEAFIDSDPKLKHEINKIKAESSSLSH